MSPSSSKCITCSVMLQPSSLATTVIYKTMIFQPKHHSDMQMSYFLWYGWEFSNLRHRKPGPLQFNTSLQLSCTKIPNWWMHKHVQVLTNWLGNITNNGLHYAFYPTCSLVLKTMYAKSHQFPTSRNHCAPYRGQERDNEFTLFQENSFSTNLELLTNYSGYIYIFHKHIQQ